jgi:hypothetical protein
MNTETRMSSNLDQIRDQQRGTWDRFSAGWKKWDTMVLGWLAPVGAAMIRHAKLREDSHADMRVRSCVITCKAAGFCTMECMRECWV